MPIKPYKTIAEQREIQIRRNLKIDNDKCFDDYITNNNYFNVINGIEDLLLVNSSIQGKNYETENFKDYIRLHKFDKKLSNEIVAIIHDFETKLRASIARNFCEMYCNSPKHTMQYTNKNNYRDISKREIKNNYPFRNEQYGKIIGTFYKFNLFEDDFLQKIIKKNGFIDERVFSISSKDYSPPKNCSSYRIKGTQKDEEDREVVVPFWVAIETLTFGTLIFLCHYLKPVIIKMVLADFNIHAENRDLFLNTLDIIRDLRNKCAHFSLINRFSTSFETKLSSTMIQKLNLQPLTKQRRIVDPKTNKQIYKPAAQLTLFDTLKILGLYQDLSTLNKHFKKIIYKNNKHFKKKSYDLNERLLKRMGNPNYKEWKELFKNQKYFLTRINTKTGIR